MSKEYLDKIEEAISYFLDTIHDDNKKFIWHNKDDVPTFPYNNNIIIVGSDGYYFVKHDLSGFWIVNSILSPTNWDLVKKYCQLEKWICLEEINYD